MSISTITYKGQTTIPIQIRSYLNIHPGDKIEFFINDDGQVMIAPLTSHITQLKGMLAKPKRIVSIEKMNKTIKIRGGRYERD